MTEFAPQNAWLDDNALGLVLAADQRWDDAAHIFEIAIESLRSTTDEDAGALSLVLGNLATCLFHSGRIDEALNAADEACALRVAEAGVDSLPVARLRADMAVMFAMQGKFADATAMLARAVAQVEAQKGDTAIELAPMLENSARISLATGNVAAAEPLLLRLHALLDEAGESTVPAEALLSHVASVRTGDPLEIDSDDELLMESVALTGELLRTTPPGVPILERDQPQDDEPHVLAEVFEDEGDEAEPQLVSSERLDEDDARIVDPFDTDLELVEPAPPTLDVVPEHRRHVHRDDDALGFLVQHGLTVTPDQPPDSIDEVELALPALSPHIFEAAPEVAATSEAPPMVPLPESRTPHKPITVQRSSRDVPVVLPSPGKAPLAVTEVDSEKVDRFVAARKTPNSGTVLSRVTGARPTVEPVLKDKPRVRASGGARVWLVVGGGLAAMAAAAAWYLAGS